jgi:hypothetical protein
MHPDDIPPPSRPRKPGRARPLVAMRTSQYGAPNTRTASSIALYTHITVASPPLYLVRQRR